MLRLYSHFNNVIIFLKKRSSYGQRLLFSDFSIAIIIQHRNHFFGPNCSFKNIIYIIAKVLSDTSKIDISHSHDITAFVEGADPSHLSTQFQRTNPTISKFRYQFLFLFIKVLLLHFLNLLGHIL